MDIVHAVWEKRNSGLNTFEVTIKKNDKDLSKIFDLKKYCEYITVKVNNGDIKKTSELENNGFNFLETRLSICLQLKKYSFPKDIRKFTENNPFTENIVQSKKDLNAILELIPDMFISDRISLDPLLKKNTSENRYKNWLIDMFESKDITICSVKSKQQIIGFYAYSEEINSMDSILGGISSKLSGSGMGFYLMVKPILRSISKNHSSFNTVISSNNLPVVRLYLKFGFQIKDIEYVFRWKKQT